MPNLSSLSMLFASRLSSVGVIKPRLEHHHTFRSSTYSNGICLTNSKPNDVHLLSSPLMTDSSPWRGLPCGRQPGSHQCRTLVRRCWRPVSHFQSIHGAGSDRTNRSGAHSAFGGDAPGRLVTGGMSPRPIHTGCVPCSRAFTPSTDTCRMRAYICGNSYDINPSEFVSSFWKCAACWAGWTLAPSSGSGCL